MKPDKPSIRFGTVEVGRTPGLKHLEHWPAGVTLCGVDMFPPAGHEPSGGMARGGGRSDWDTPCPECIRYAQRFRSSCSIEVEGMFAADFRRRIGGLGSDSADERSAISIGARADLAAEAARLAAPLFEAAGWEWRDIGVPDAAAIAAILAPRAERIDFDGSISSGRLHVSRWIEDGVETIQVSVDLAEVSVDVVGVKQIAADEAEGQGRR